MSKDSAEIVKSEDRPQLARREFLAKSSALIGTAALGSFVTAAEAAQPAYPRAAENVEPLAVPSWTKSLGEPTAKPYGAPSKFETTAVRSLYPGLKEPMSAYSTSPLQALDGILTPNGLFYERHHAGVPHIDPSQHQMLIHGLTEQSLVFSVEEIRQFPAVSRIHFIECSGTSVGRSAIFTVIQRVAVIKKCELPSLDLNGHERVVESFQDWL